MTTVNGVKDNPQALAAWHAANVFYGDDDPRGRPMSKRSVESIARQDLVAVPRQVVRAQQRHPRRLGRRRRQGAQADAAEDVRRVEEEGRAAGDRRAGATAAGGGQGACRCGSSTSRTRRSRACSSLGPGIRHADPQYYAVRLMNYALGGGGFSSRLMKVVRSEGGKTYGVRSSFDAGRDAGPFDASTFTRNAETAATLKLVLDEIAQDARGRADRRGAQGGQEQLDRRLRAAPRDRHPIWPRS